MMVTRRLMRFHQLLILRRPDLCKSDSLESIIFIGALTAAYLALIQPQSK